jgi:hypothetical protein
MGVGFYSLPNWWTGEGRVKRAITQQIGHRRAANACTRQKGMCASLRKINKARQLVSWSMRNSLARDSFERGRGGRARK